MICSSVIYIHLCVKENKKGGYSCDGRLPFGQRELFHLCPFSRLGDDFDIEKTAANIRLSAGQSAQRQQLTG
jgi:hypothetical protein